MPINTGQPRSSPLTAIHRALSRVHSLRLAAPLRLLNTTMSSTCGNCDCPDKSQCVKKGNGYGVVITETEKSYYEEVIEVSAAAEHDGKCKCGASCTCADCTCGK